MHHISAHVSKLSSLLFVYTGLQFWFLEHLSLFESVFSYFFVLKLVCLKIFHGHFFHVFLINSSPTIHFRILPVESTFPVTVYEKLLTQRAISQKLFWHANRNFLHSCHKTCRADIECIMYGSFSVTGESNPWLKTSASARNFFGFSENPSDW